MDCWSNKWVLMTVMEGKFDVLLLEPPLEEDHRHSITLDPTGSGDPSKLFWSWPEIMSLLIEEVAAQRSFIFLWCGSSDGPMKHFLPVIDDTGANPINVLKVSFAQANTIMHWKGIEKATESIALP